MARAVSSPNRYRLEHASTDLVHHRGHQNFDGLVAVNNISYEVLAGKSWVSWRPKGPAVDFLQSAYRLLYAEKGGVLSWSGHHRHARRSTSDVGIARTFQLVSVFDSMTVMENMMLARVRKSQDYSSKIRFFFRNCRYRALQDECLSVLDLLGIADKSEVNPRICPTATSESWR